MQTSLSVARDRVVGILYHREEEPVPLICSKARGQAGDEMVAEARRLGIPVAEDASQESIFERR